MHGKMGISGSLYAAVILMTGGGCCAPVFHLHRPMFAEAEPEEKEQGVPTSFPPRPRLHPVPTRPVFHPVKSGEETTWKASPKPAIEPKSPEPAAEIQVAVEQATFRSVKAGPNAAETGVVRTASGEQRSVLVRPAGQWRARMK
jgi:hypothetical protein